MAAAALTYFVAWAVDREVVGAVCLRTIAEIAQFGRRHWIRSDLLEQTPGLRCSMAIFVFGFAILSLSLHVCVYI